MVARGLTGDVADVAKRFSVKTSNFFFQIIFKQICVSGFTKKQTTASVCKDGQVTVLRHKKEEKKVFLLKI